MIGTVTVIDDVTERVKREAELQLQLEQNSTSRGESAARSAGRKPPLASFANGDR